jgi:hypothetical protein
VPNLVVITGAGASHDCASGNVVKYGGLAPPLVKDLFSDDYRDALNRYPLVRQAATDIRRATRGAGDSAIPLEEFLRDHLRASENPYTQRRYRQIPLYLQEVLNSTRGYTPEPDNYNALVNAALEFDTVLFLTLNYDTILDDRIAEYQPLEDLDWYVKTDDRWALVKLHGSVNWGWPIELPPETQYASTVEWANGLIDGLARLPEFDPAEIVLRKGTDVAHFRLGDVESHTVYYPALAVPLGEADDLVCPPHHVDVAREALAASDGLNLLVVGYSGADREVLRLLTESGNKPRKVLIANGPVETTIAAAGRIGEAFGIETVDDEWIFPGGFTDLVAQGALHQWLDSLT